MLSYHEFSAVHIFVIPRQCNNEDRICTIIILMIIQINSPSEVRNRFYPKYRLYVKQSNQTSIPQKSIISRLFTTDAQL